ncbi:hypothetical protein FRC15_001626 [Serendipita sp. 397]|nr:hypothetical protein FRC15_001626 [Serendipita sp. 397]KAG8800423.1 hypothetical protein FRC16_002904 [Serendipita sp. 398]
MIITDESSDRPPSPSFSKTSHSAPTETDFSSAGEVTRTRHQLGPLDTRAAPPSYSVATSTSGGLPSPRSPMLPRRYQLVQPQAMAQNYQDYTLLATAEEHRREISRRTKKRFVKALLVAFLCYFLVMMFFGSLFEMTFVRGPNGVPLPPAHPSIPDHSPNTSFPRYPDPNEPSGPVQNKPWPSRLDGEIVKCYGEDSWSPDIKSSLPSINANEIIISTGDPDEDDYPYTVYNAFTIPMDATSFSLFSRGRHAFGGVVIRAVETKDEGDADLIKVVIRASYRFDDALHLLNICHMKDKKKQWRGLGVYTTRDFNVRENVWLHIDFMFPKRKDSAAWQIDRFSSSLPQFAHSISTGQDIHFNDLILVTSNDKINSDGVITNGVVATTSNGAITGSYNVTGSTVLATTNGKIQVDLNLFHKEGNALPDASLTTRNGPIDLRTSLYHINDQLEALKDGGHFKVTAATTNGHVDVTYLDAPVDSILNNVVSTTNGRIETRLHSTYEGDVTIVTSNAAIEVHQDEETKDPSGRDRQRVVTWGSRWNTMLSGWIGWGEKKPHTGSVTASTTNGRNRLYF